MGQIRPGVYACHMREVTQNLRMFTSLFLKFIRAHTDKLVEPIFTFDASFDAVLCKVVRFAGQKF